MESTSRSQLILTNSEKLKKDYFLFQKCPICQNNIKFGIKRGYLEEGERYPYPCIILHGIPLHALVVYIDANHKIRAIDTAKSIEIQK